MNTLIAEILIGLFAVGVILAAFIEMGRDEMNEFKDGDITSIFHQ